MRTVTSTVRLNLPRLRQLDQAGLDALEQTAEAIHTDLVQSQTMPFRQGTLQNDSTFVDASGKARGHVELASSTPYARRLYFHPEYQFSKAENPNAGGAWFAPYAPGGEKEDYAAKTFRQLYRREAGL